MSKKRVMKEYFTNISKKIIKTAIVLFGLSTGAQELPFNCDYNAYLFQYNDVYAIDLASGNSYVVATDVTTGNINAAAYNPADGFIWGSLSSPAKTIVRIGKNFETTTFYIDELPTNNRYVGGINAHGIYYLKGGGTTYYKIDLNPDSANYGNYISTETLSKNISIHDWAFNAVDGNLYTVEKNTNLLYRINADTGIAESLGEVPVLSGLNYTYGAVYFDVTGSFYVSANQTGTVYRINNVQDINESNPISANIFAFGPSSSSNDGARCPTAPVPQENCNNGVDDDGDGLVDCDDPSCSGVSSCPVIEAPTSGGNSGGLESNNRLSDQINKRNFNRIKTNYKFDEKTAKKLRKTDSYAKKSTSTNIKIKDFIPIGLLNEDYIVESSPLDLLNITNATDLYSVDYMNNGNIVASILALKTDKGVYEHTKYICDRLLGAELISVSTIEINGQSFIKSIIKNTDNSIEYVLSFSAKKINSEKEFSIESHWNLDKYSSNQQFYNFQIWSNSIDDLLLLGSNVLELLQVQNPITEYNLSKPPTVFVKKGNYVKGGLELEVVNTNGTREIVFDAGIRDTETSTIEYVSATIDLEKKYISTLTLETGNLFDIGFRIGDGISTPDDLFMSDGPWGIDDAAKSTVVKNYKIGKDVSSRDASDFPIERNVSITADTKEYVSVYRALTPRFKAVDLSNYSNLKLTTKGTGQLEIRIIKKSISSWEDQFKATISLDTNFQNHEIALESFTSSALNELQLNDIVSIVFTMKSADGTLETKNLSIKDLSFSVNKTLSTESETLATINPTLFPNPMSKSATITFTATKNHIANLFIYNVTGKLVKQLNFDVVTGINEVVIDRDLLTSGLYFCKIGSPFHSYDTMKLLIE